MSRKSLKEYISEDKLYQDYLVGEVKDPSDFDMFCIEHCKDVAEVLADVERLEAIEKEHQALNGCLRAEVSAIDTVYLEREKDIDEAINFIKDPTVSVTKLEKGDGLVDRKKYLLNILNRRKSQ